MCLALAIVPASPTYADDATAPVQQQTTDNSNNTDTPDNPDNLGKPDNPGTDSGQHTDPSNGAIDAYAATHMAGIAYRRSHANHRNRERR